LKQYKNLQTVSKDFQMYRQTYVAICRRAAIPAIASSGAQKPPIDLCAFTWQVSPNRYDTPVIAKVTVKKRHESPQPKMDAK
jgi:hypothetical protein